MIFSDNLSTFGNILLTLLEIYYWIWNSIYEKYQSWKFQVTLEKRLERIQIWLQNTFDISKIFENHLSSK